MRNPLPPLSWVLAFETAARHENFVKAGDELGVSPGAVSQKVKALEDNLGRQLFERLSRGVRLTEQGQAYANLLTPLIDGIQVATAQCAGRDAGLKLFVSALPALAERWLVPRLSGFTSAHPEISIDLSAEARAVDFSRDAVDVALRYTEVPPEEALSQCLFTEILFPVCSPEFLERNPLRVPEDVLSAPILHDAHWKADWDVWFAAIGIALPKNLKQTSFTLYSMAVEAAIRGQGVAMGHDVLVAEDLASGRLVAPLGLRVPAPGAHYVLVAGPSLRRAHVRAFVDWLSEQAPGGKD